MLRKTLIASVAALALAACSQTSTNSTTETNVVDTNESGVGNGEGSTMVEDTSSQAVGGVTAPTINTAADFVPAAAISDMYEIEASKLALQKSKSADVKQFAQMMIKDHTATTAKVKTILTSGKLDITPPTALDDRRQGMIDNLKAASAADFDKVYLDQQTAAHQEALAMMKSYAEDGDNPALKQFASETAPKIQQHYDKAQQLDNAGADGTN
jgi:putative membrane protein